MHLPDCASSLITFIFLVSSRRALCFSSSRNVHGSLHLLSTERLKTQKNVKKTTTSKPKSVSARLGSAGARLELARLGSSRARAKSRVFSLAPCPLPARLFELCGQFLDLSLTRSLSSLRGKLKKFASPVSLSHPSLVPRSLARRRPPVERRQVLARREFWEEHKVLGSERAVEVEAHQAPAADRVVGLVDRHASRGGSSLSGGGGSSSSSSSSFSSSSSSSSSSGGLERFAHGLDAQIERRGRHAEPPLGPLGGAEHPKRRRSRAGGVVRAGAAEQALAADLAPVGKRRRVELERLEREPASSAVNELLLLLLLLLMRLGGQRIRCRRARAVVDVIVTRGFDVHALLENKRFGVLSVLFVRTSSCHEGIYGCGREKKATRADEKKKSTRETREPSAQAAATGKRDSQGYSLVGARRQSSI